MDSGDLNHGHAIRAENLSLTSFCPVNGRIDSHVMSDVSGSAMCGGNHVSHAEALAFFAGGTLVESIKEHCKAPS